MSRRIIFIILSFILIASFSFGQNIDIKIQVPGRENFLFGDKIFLNFEINSSEKFNSIQIIPIEYKFKPDNFDFKFNILEENMKYFGEGKIEFQYFRVGNIKLPDFEIRLYKTRDRNKLEIYREEFKGININYVSSLKNKRELIEPKLPEMSNFKYITAIVGFFFIILIIIFLKLIYKKIKDIKSREKTGFKYDLRDDLEKAKRMIENSKFFKAEKLVYEILKKILSIEAGKNFNGLSIKEKGQYINNTGEHGLFELFKNVNYQMYQPSVIDKKLLKKALDVIERKIEKIENDNL